MLGDAFGAGIVYHLSKKELDEQDRIKGEEALEMKETSGLEEETNRTEKPKHGRMVERV